jgi:hypothetical protein
MQHRPQYRLVPGRTQPVEQADEERLVDAAPHDAAWCPVGGRSGWPPACPMFKVTVASIARQVAALFVDNSQRTKA